MHIKANINSKSSLKLEIILEQKNLKFLQILQI